MKLTTEEEIEIERIEKILSDEKVSTDTDDVMSHPENYVSYDESISYDNDSIDYSSQY